MLNSLGIGIIFFIIIVIILTISILIDKLSARSRSANATIDALKSANAAIDALKNDLERIQGQLNHELNQVSHLREVNTGLSDRYSRLVKELALSQKQVEGLASSSTSVSATPQSSPTLNRFATQVLKFLAASVSSLETVPYHADEHYQKAYLLELEEGSSLLTADITDLYNESTQRLFTHWAPIIQASILSANSDKKVLQNQLNAAQSVVINSNVAKAKISEVLEAVRKEASLAKAALTKQLALGGTHVKQANEKLVSDAAALMTAYMTCRQSIYYEVSTTTAFKYWCLFPYLPTRAQATAEQQRNRERVWRFKDGLNTQEIAYLISIALLRSFTPVQLQSMAFAVIPASTSVKNRIRYEKFCAFVSEYTGLTNGFEFIGVAQDREALKGSTSANKVANLVYNKANIKGRNILIFDDVMTTGGSFIQNAARLVENGATEVSGIFLARTQRI